MVSTMVWPSRLSRRTNCHSALAQLHVDAGGGLVEHDHRRLVHQRLRHQHAPLHAAGERAHVGVGLGGEVEVLQHLVDPGVVAAQAEVARLDAQRLAHGEERVEHQLLRHHAEHAARAAVVGDARRAPMHATPPGVGARQAGDDVDQRGLAGAVRAEQAEELALLDGEAHAGERAQARRSASRRRVTSIAFSVTATGSRLVDAVEARDGLQRLGQVGERELALAAPAPRAARRAAAASSAESISVTSAEVDAAHALGEVAARPRRAIARHVGERDRPADQRCAAPSRRIISSRRVERRGSSPAGS